MIIGILRVNPVNSHSMCLYLTIVFVFIFEGVAPLANKLKYKRIKCSKHNTLPVNLCWITSHCSEKVYLQII